MASLALGPVAVAVYAALNVAGLTALATGGIYDDVPQAPSYPFVWFELFEQEARGFGTGGLPEVTVRVHAFSTYAGTKEAQSITKKAIELLKDQTLTVVGYTFCGRVFYDETTPVLDEELNGVKVREQVANFRLYVEE